MLLKRNLKIPGVLTAVAAALLLTANVFAGNYKDRQNDIVDTAVKAGTFNTLAAAIEAGGLVGTLKSDGPFTVFAPTDEAFAKLPEGTVENLLLPENKDQLVEILTYHVVPGRVKAADVVKLNSAATANGAELSIRVENETVFVNDARVVATDIAASNGVIHVVDTVILPAGP